jgi:hypothetical protein
MAHRFYDVIPEDLRENVDLLVREFEPEAWPVRFFVLLSMLLASVEENPAPGRPYAINAWKAVVTGLLEHLKPDVTQPECLALMAASVSDIFQIEASVHMKRDPTIPDRLRSTYPEWMAVEELLEEFDHWEKGRLSENRPH